ncbi:hypothetical protein FH972_008170 [Carpinus fangiana]|uniref:Uncharacterized protein n=1 Tax=Carpinus fangiana TaxID=176857 RepID=A0A5N6QXV1_9ROSI|nr:hypothetical protein FH972_008170 [Carpinus fangiana]
MSTKKPHKDASATTHAKLPSSNIIQVSSTLALVSPPVEQDPGMAVGHSLPAKVSDDTNFDTFSGLSVQDKAYMDTSSASALQPESPILAGIQCDSFEVIPGSSDSSAGTDFGFDQISKLAACIFAGSGSGRCYAFGARE